MCRTLRTTWELEEYYVQFWWQLSFFYTFFRFSGLRDSSTHRASSPRCDRRWPGPTRAGPWTVSSARIWSPGEILECFSSCQARISIIYQNHFCGKLGMDSSPKLVDQGPQLLVLGAVKCLMLKSSHHVSYTGWGGGRGGFLTRRRAGFWSWTVPSDTFANLASEFPKELLRNTVPGRHTGQQITIWWSGTTGTKQRNNAPPPPPLKTKATGEIALYDTL
jgi:hypothetical protein